MNKKTQSSLTDKQKEHLKSIIGDQYIIEGQLGRTGAHTVAYELIDKQTGEKKVLLCPHGTTSLQKELEYKVQQEKSNKCRDFCAEGYDSKNGCFLPETTFCGDTLYRITSYAGKELTEQRFSQLSEVEKQRVVHQFAGWLNFIHQKSFVKKDMLNSVFSKYKVGEIQQSDMWEDFTTGEKKIPFAQKVLETFGAYMGKLQKKEIQELIDAYQHRDKKDEICVLTHGDLRDANVLYNAEKEQVSIIDFERISVTSVYRDFCTFCRSGLAPEMIVNTVSVYNQLPKSHPVHINPQKVKNFLLLAYLHELTREARPESSKQLWTSFKKYYKKVSSAFSHTEQPQITPQPQIAPQHKDR